jgi:anti-sigma regulatory factor (Ser/Thr protein kinase)
LLHTAAQLAADGREDSAMTSRETHRRSLRMAHSVTLEPSALAGSERFRAVTLDADAPDTGSVIRRTAFEVLHDWGLHQLVENVTLCLSELVGNSVQHAVPDGWHSGASRGRRVAVAFRAWPTCLFLEVSDEDSTPPMLPAGDLLSGDGKGVSAEALLADSGRGLLIIQSLSDAAWWAPRDEGGKSVFCRFDHDGLPLATALCAPHEGESGSHGA